MKNRVLKFRVWHKQDKTYLSNVSVEFWRNEFYVIGNSYDIFLGSNKDCVVQQSTGLKDKKGKEIYEGDIVTSQTLCNPLGEDDDLTPITKIKIVWSEELAAWGCYLLNKREQKVGPLRKDDYPLYAVEKSSLEVIGNIYQNSELLN